MEIFTLDNLFTLGVLTLLQAVLGFDNLLYISLESKNAPLEKQQMVRRLGIGVAIFLRIFLLFALIKVIQYFQDPFISFDLNFFNASFNVHSVIVLLGGIFIIYTSVKEIFHMIAVKDLGHHEVTKKSVASVILWIVLMNLVFSFDSILSAMALSDVFIVMATAIIIGGVLMIWLADRVTTFLHNNRMYEVLGLFVLFIVGIMLLSEGGHIAHISVFGYEVTPMSKVTFYFVITILVLIDLVQGRYQKKLLSG